MTGSHIGRFGEFERIRPPVVDIGELGKRRLNNLRSTMVEHGLGLCVLTNPVSVRYAIDYRGYASFQSRIPSSYVVLAVDGPVFLYGVDTEGTCLADVTRDPSSVTTFDAGLDLAHASGRFVRDISAVIEELGIGPDLELGVERLLPTTHHELRSAGVHVVDAEPTIELARSRKVAGEIDLIRHSIDVAELAMGKMQEALRPGVTENRLWSILHQVNIEHDGDWIDGRMLCSGPRSNPWYQEASHREILAGDLVPFDTDMVGPFGYCADISRTFLCGDGAPSAEQSDLYALAALEVEHNTSLLRVGASFEELSRGVLRHDEDIVANRYACAFHGVGMSDEYPKIPYPDDWARIGYEGEVEEGLVLSVESYVGRLGASEGVKLEQMVQVTTDGVVPLSTYPLWD